jgi:hypothetical protein
MMAWMKRLDAIPLWLFGLLTMVAFNTAALGGLVGARQLGHRPGLYGLVDNDTVGWIFSAIVVIYAIAIGQIAVATWTNATAASSVASQEASQIAVTVSHLGRVSAAIAERDQRCAYSLPEVHHRGGLAGATTW